MGKVDRTSFLTIKMYKIIECSSQVVDSHDAVCSRRFAKKNQAYIRKNLTLQDVTSLVCVFCAINVSLPIYYVMYAPCAHVHRRIV